MKAYACTIKDPRNAQSCDSGVHFMALLFKFSLYTVGFVDDQVEEYKNEKTGKADFPERFFFLKCRNRRNSNLSSNLYVLSFEGKVVGGCTDSGGRYYRAVI